MDPKKGLRARDYIPETESARKRRIDSMLNAFQKAFWKAEAIHPNLTTVIVRRKNDKTVSIELRMPKPRKKAG